MTRPKFLLFLKFILFNRFRFMEDGDDKSKKGSAMESGNSNSQPSTSAAGKLPKELVSSVDSISISEAGGGGSSATRKIAASSVPDTKNISASALDLPFNMDNIDFSNLAELTGLDFDVANLLGQVSSSLSAAKTVKSISKRTEKKAAPAVTKVPVASQRPSPPGSTSTAANVSAARPVRPPPATGTAKGNPVRPRPLRPTVRARPPSTTPNPAVRPSVRPGAVNRPRPPIRPGTGQPAIRPSAPVGRPAPRPGVRPVATRSPGTTKPAAALSRSPPPVNPTQSSTSNTAIRLKQQQQQQQSLLSTATDPTAELNKTEDEEEGEEHFLTESVEVKCPPLVHPPQGFETLYGLEEAFRSLCHGVSPTNAEWSSLNILAVTWPQLEIAPAASRRRPAERDISDIINMSTTDSMGWSERQLLRPPSSTIHLYRLHAHPPPAWDTGSRLKAIQPSLLPLCDLRMQQGLNEQIQQTGMNQMLDTFAISQPDQSTISSDAAPRWPSNTVNISPLSGGHGGTIQVGKRDTMRIASAPRCIWSADCQMLATADRAGRFEIFSVDSELNSWKSVYHVDFNQPVIACLWLANRRKYGISRRVATTNDNSSGGNDMAAADKTEKQEGDIAGAQQKAGGSDWSVDSDIYIRRLPFFGPRNTQGEYALVVATADGQLILIYQKDEQWERVVAPLEPKRRGEHWKEASSMTPSEGENVHHSDQSDPWSHIPSGLITHADMMLISKKWIYIAVHRAGASSVSYPHEPGAIADELKQDGAMEAPTIEVYRVQVEFASDYSPRLFATPLVIQPVTLPVSMLDKDSDSDSMAVDTDGDDLTVARVTHLKLITALNPEVRPVERNVLGENHYFPLIFVSMGKQTTRSTATSHDAYTTFIQVWRLEGARHAQRSVSDLLRRPPPLKLSHMWTESRKGLLLSVIANRAERQQLRYIFAKPSDKDYRALMLTWANGGVEMLRNYQDHDGVTRSDVSLDTECFDQCVQPVDISKEWVIGSVLSPHYTTYFQLVMKPWTVELGKKDSTKRPAMDIDGSDSIAAATTAVSCVWGQGHAWFRLGWTPFPGDNLSAGSDTINYEGKQSVEALGGISSMSAHVRAYSGDLLAVRVLNKEDPTDLVALLATIAAREENHPIPAWMVKRTKPAPSTSEAQADKSGLAEGKDDTALSVPMSRTLSQALFRACTLLTNALDIKKLGLDPLASTTPFLRRLLGAIMQTHFLARHNIQATSLGQLLHIASAAEAQRTAMHEHLLQAFPSGQEGGTVAGPFSPAQLISNQWQQTFLSTTALVLWCIDLFAAIIRDTYLYLNVRCADSEGALRSLCELDGDVEPLLSKAMSSKYLHLPSDSAEEGEACLLPSGLPSRLALLFHSPTLDAIRSLATFVSRLEIGLIKQIQSLNTLPSNASNLPEYAGIAQSRDMLISTAQQLAHAFEHLPVGIEQIKNFLTEVHDLYVDDEECMSLEAQVTLISSSTVTSPFRKFLPRLSQCFSRFILEPETMDATSNKSASLSTLVLHDTRWMRVVICQSNLTGIANGTTVFETPWRVKLPIEITDPNLIEEGKDALVPAAAELIENEREKREFERALDEDKVLFDIDDPGFIFFDTSDSSAQPAKNTASSGGLADSLDTMLSNVALDGNNGPSAEDSASNILATAASRAAAKAPVKITTRVPDFSDVLDSYMARRAGIADVDVDYMLKMPLPFESMLGYDALTDMRGGGCGDDSSIHSNSRSATRSNSVANFSLSMAPLTGGANSIGGGDSHALSSSRGSVQHFVPHYSSISLSNRDSKEKKLSSGWQFISTSRDPKLHIPTLLGQHAYSLALMNRNSRTEGEGEDVNGMTYCIDWSRSNGMAVEEECSVAHRQSTKTNLVGCANRVDVVQKTMLPADVPVKMCLRCGHVTRQQQPNGNSIGWIHRFDTVCICGGSWLAV